MRSEFESREVFERIFGGEGEIDLSKDETGEYSFQPSRFAYSFFLVAWQYRQTEVDDLQKRVDAVKQLIQEYRDPPTEDKTFCYALSIVADEIEQALKGGEDESN